MDTTTNLGRGALLMAIAGVAFIGYGIVFLIWNFASGGFELGVDTLNGVSRAELNGIEPGIAYYISHLHVATAAFIITTGIAVAGLSWFGVARGEWWAWLTAVLSGVLGLALALPMHWMDLFEHEWVTHLGPIYLAAVVFVVGAAYAYQAIRFTATGVNRFASESAAGR